MATVTIKKLIDDIDGSDADRTVKFTIGPRKYEIDLSHDNYRAFEEALKPWVDKARSTNRNTRKPAARKPQS